MLAFDKSAPAKAAASACVLSMAVEVTMVCSVAPRRFARVKLARMNQANVRSALVRLASVRSAPTSFPPWRLAPDKFALTSRSSAPGRAPAAGAGDDGEDEH